MNLNWEKLLVPKSQLQLIGTLNGGQSFRWKRNVLDKNEEQWIGVFRNCVWILQQNNDHVLYKVYDSSNDGTKRSKKDNRYYSELLKSYFRLDSDIVKLYSEWSENDPIFKTAAEHFYGIRMLNQEPTENLFSFICSQNNHINRISTMVENLCKFYGEEICEINNKTYYTFPSVEKLAAPDVETRLRDANFGYRAKYISQSAQQIMKLGGTNWFKKLEEMDYMEAKLQLCQLTGIGAKVADCICLMSLGHLQAIPVDTHVYKIAKEHYLPSLNKTKTVTKRTYNQIGNHFRLLFGDRAGWAHTVLFCADLKKLKTDIELQNSKK